MWQKLKPRLTYRKMICSVARTAWGLHLKALPELLAVPMRRFEPVCVFYYLILKRF